MSPLGEAFRRAMANPGQTQGQARPAPAPVRPQAVPQFDLGAVPGVIPPARPAGQGAPAPARPAPQDMPGPTAAQLLPGFGGDPTPTPPPPFEAPPASHAGAHAVLDRVSRVATFAEGPLAPGCDELAGLRAALMARGLEGMSATLMITGTVSPYVVTAIAVGLAGELARDLVHNVLLVDADARSPGAGAMLQVDPEFDFADVLDGRAEPAEAILHSEVDNLSAMLLRNDPFIGGSRVTAEMLAGPVARETLAGLHEAFDYIVIDAGSAEDSAVPRVLAARSTGVVMVVEAGTARDRVRACRGTIESAGGRVLGVVLTGTGTRRRSSKG